MSTKKIWSRVISMLLVLVLLPVSALAQADPQVVTEPKFKVERFYVDPEMERLGLTVGRLPRYDFAVLGSETMESLAEAGEYVREQAENRVEAFSVTVNNYEFAGEAQLMEDLLTIENALMVHTGVPTQGDYIRRHLTQYGYSVSVTSTQLISNWTVVYKTDAEQEKVVDERVDELIAQWDAECDIHDLSDEEKITVIYDYICDNVTYDYTHLSQGSGYPLMFSAYAALIDGTAVCQGYSNLFYRLALELGVDTRIISGFGNGGPHSWNIAQLDDSYYYLDSTWDAGRADYAYFLLGSKAFLWDHALDEEFKAEEFQKEYPVSESDYDPDALLIEKATRAGLLDYFESYTIDGELTRLDLAKLVAALAELTLDSDASLAYEDCGDLTDEEKQIVAAVEKFGVMQGYDDATFRPLETVSRAVAAVVVYRAMNDGVDADDIGDYADGGLFADVSASSWYAPYVNYLASIGVIRRDRTGNFGPTETALFGAVLRWAANAAGDEITLAAPTVKAENVASTGKIKLTWDEVEGAQGYEVWRATSKNGEYTKLTTTTKTSVTNTRINAGETYYYKVRAIADDVQGEFSEIVGRTCDLARPTVKTTNIASTGKIKISWNKVDGAVKYEVYRATSKNGKYTKLTTTTKTSITNTKIDAGETYYYKVKAIAKSSAANSAASVAVGRTCDLARPEVTVKLNSNGKPVVSWKKVTGAVKYEVYRATSENGKYTKLTTTTKTSITNSKTEAGVTYYYRVRAIAKNSAANSAYSAIAYITAK